MKETGKLLSEVLERITPSKADRLKIEAFSKELERRVSLACQEFGVKCSVRVEGSVAKGTWLAGDPDVDVFMRLPASISRDALGGVSLKIARRATEGSRQVERFAEHPYLEAFVDGTRVNIVPCYDVKPGEWLSATDRTPFHTDYVNQRLDKVLRNEVLLLKKFLKSIGVYGAEIKIGGFSGYLCELLILHYGSFLETLRAFSQCGQRKVVDIEKYYAGRMREVQLLFGEPLVIVDPVDKGRNVASAVQTQKLDLFAVTARAFLKAPNSGFFFPPKPKAMSAAELKRKVGSHGSSVVFLTFAALDAVPDVLWGQLYRTQRSLRKLMELNDFNVLRDAVWTDEKNLTVFVLELELLVLPGVRRHLGPPLEREQECEKFLAKYASNNDVVSGPYVEGGRWAVELRRKQTDAVEFLSAKLRQGGKGLGFAELISKALMGRFEILVGAEVVEVYGKNREFAVFLTDFLVGKPFGLGFSGV